KWLRQQLDEILNDPSIIDGVPKLEILVKDPKLIFLRELIAEIQQWDSKTGIPKTIASQICAMFETQLIRMLENISYYRKYLERLLPKFEAFNERIGPDQDTPLHYAIKQHKREFIDWLLNHSSIDPNIRNAQSKTPLYLLCEDFRAGIDVRDCILFLLDKGANFNIYSGCPSLAFELLMDDQSEENLKFLEECTRRHRYGAIAIGKTNEELKKRCVGFYQEPHVEVNVTVELLEVFLGFKEHDRFIEELALLKVNEGNVRNLIKVLLHTAVELGLEECVRKIVQIVDTLSKAQGDKRDSMLKCAEILIKSGKVSYTLKDSLGNTALHMAAKNGFKEIAVRLLQLKNNFLGVRNRDNLTPLDYAGSFVRQLTILIGSLPFKIATYMHMFNTITYNFLLSFLLFIPWLSAFTYCFYLSHSVRSNHTAPTEANNDSFNTFGTFTDAALKTLVMTTGEFDASNLDLNDGKMILLVLFIFFVPFVFLNLINGLAVSDITEIRKEAELIGIRKKVMILYRVTVEEGLSRAEKILTVDVIGREKHLHLCHMLSRMAFEELPYHAVSDVLTFCVLMDREVNGDPWAQMERRDKRVDNSVAGSVADNFVKVRRR
ncbi:hypothetical protein pipiens_016501, partial [Culex pipiens pipiens]